MEAPVVPEPSLAAFREFVEVMSAAPGWDVQEFSSLLDRGIALDPAAIAANRDLHIILDLSFRMADRRLALNVFDPDGETVLCLRLYPKQQRELLAQIIAAQPKLQPDTCADLVPTLIPFCERVVVEDRSETLEVSLADDGTVTTKPTESDDAPGTAVWS